MYNSTPKSIGYFADYPTSYIFQQNILVGSWWLPMTGEIMPS